MTRRMGALILLLCCPGVTGAEDSARASLGDSRFVAGGEVVLDSPVRGNAFAAGGRVEIREKVVKSAFVSGGVVIVTGAIGRDLYAAGGTIEIDGAVGGDLHAYGERIEFNGTVGGDVELAGDNLRLGPAARIAGRVVYLSGRDIVVDPAAEVAGGVAKSRKNEEWLRKLGRGATIVGAATFLLGMLLLGGVLVLGMPRFSREAALSIRRKPWQALGLGCAMLIGVPIAIAILVVTLVGIPLALLLAFSYVALLMLGHLIAAIFVGDQALERVGPAKLDSVWWRALFMLLAFIAIAFARQLPIVGDLAWWLLFLAGIGAFTMRTWEGFRNDPLTASSTGSVRRPPPAAG